MIAIAACGVSFSLASPRGFTPGYGIAPFQGAIFFLRPRFPRVSPRAMELHPFRVRFSFSGHVFPGFHPGLRNCTLSGCDFLSPATFSQGSTLGCGIAPFQGAAPQRGAIPQPGPTGRDNPRRTNQPFLAPCRGAILYTHTPTHPHTYHQSAFASLLRHSSLWLRRPKGFRLHFISADKSADKSSIRNQMPTRNLQAGSAVGKVFSTPGAYS